VLGCKGNFGSFMLWVWIWIWISLSLSLSLQLRFSRLGRHPKVKEGIEVIKGLVIVQLGGCLHESAIRDIEGVA